MTMEEGTVVDWRRALGDPVAKGEGLLVIESEKSDAEIEATASGFLRHVYVEAGETVACGTLLAALTDAADETFDAADFAAVRAGPEPRGTPRPAPPPAVLERPVGGRRRRPVAPAARARARELGIDPVHVQGTGPGGRVTRRDVEAWAIARERRVPVDDGVALEVPREGAGDAVLLLPGFGSDASSFAPQIRWVAGHGLEALAVNPRGVGASDAPEEPSYDVPRAAADAAAVLAKTGVGSAHVVGASLGAAVAIELALAAPERVRSLTLLTPFLRPSPRLVAVAEAWIRLAEETSPATLARCLAPWLFGEALLAEEPRREHTLRGLAALLARVPAATLVRTHAGMRAWAGTREGAVGSLTAPTLVVAGEADLLTPDSPRLASAIPGARCVVLPRVGHAVAIEAPEAVNEALAHHLRARTRRDDAPRRR